MKIFITTGGTGGHIIPAIKTAELLTQAKHEVIFIGKFGRYHQMLIDEGFEVIDIPMKGFISASFIKKFLQIGLLCSAIVKSFLVISKFKPNVVVGFGGYASFAPMCAAIIKGLPTLVHEQNVKPGKANQILMKYVHQVAVSFKETVDVLSKDNGVWTGCPSQRPGHVKSHEQLLSEFGLMEYRKTILVFGGSQGSRVINEIFCQTARSLIRKRSVQIIHITGKEHENDIHQIYQNIECPVYLRPYLDSMEDAYQLADVVIARAGAATIAELAAFKKQAIFIPYPHALNHQLLNAQVYAETGQAKIINEDKLNTQNLLECLEGFLDLDQAQTNKDKLRESFKEYPAQELTNLIVHTYNKFHKTKK